MRYGKITKNVSEYFHDEISFATRTGATAKKKTSAKTAHPVETLLCCTNGIYNTLKGNVAYPVETSLT